METVTRAQRSDPAAPPPLGDDEIHAWVIHLGSPACDGSAARDILSTEEQDKAVRFKREADRRRYVASHLALRKLLGGYLGLRPDLLRFQSEQFGKPVLDHGSEHGRLSFNLAHSGDLAVIGVTKRMRLGVDVELWRPDAISPDVLARFCSANRTEMIDREVGEAKLRAFFREWTAKEAYLKAVGCGLVDEVCSVEIPASSESGFGPLEIKKKLPPHIDPLQRWALYNLTVQEGYSAALVVESSRSFVLREFRPSSA